MFFQASSDISINSLEPVLEFWVSIGIAVEVVEGIEEIVRASEIGESLDESLEVTLNTLQITVRVSVLYGTDSLLSDVFRMTSISLSQVE